MSIASRALRSSVQPWSYPVQRQLLRTFSSTSIFKTDGVFKELTAMRTPTPWIEALRAKQEADRNPSPAQPSPPSPVELTPKRMSDSYASVVLPLIGDKWLSDTYLNSQGNLRLGALFMDLDALSGVVAYRHTGGKVMTVTAAFDRISLRGSMDELCDLELSGQVRHVGKSSMDIGLQVRKLDGKTDEVLLSCSCTMVSLDPATRKPVPINPLIVETPEERAISELAEKEGHKRKELRKKSLLKYTPNADETEVIHRLWQKQIQWHDSASPLKKPANVSYMDATRLHTATMMQPQYRNRHNFMIFGGYLLRTSYELAFCCAASFGHKRPRFISLDPSTFETPVPVGSVLYLAATVVYTDPEVISQEEESKVTRVVVRVDSYVRNVEHGERKPTGTFNYSFEIDQDVRIMPRTYSEFMMYVDARRRSKTLVDMDAEALRTSVVE